MGDSNIHRLFRAMVRLLDPDAENDHTTRQEQQENGCRLLGEEETGRLPDLKYLLGSVNVSADQVSTQLRSCRTCYSMRYECDLNRTSSSRGGTEENNNNEVQNSKTNDINGIESNRNSSSSMKSFINNSNIQTTGTDTNVEYVNTNIHDQNVNNYVVDISRHISKKRNNVIYKHENITDPGSSKVSRNQNNSDTSNRDVYEVKNSTHKNIRKIFIEHFGITKALDNYLRILKPIGDIQPTNYTQEFIFRDILPFRNGARRGDVDLPGFPQVIVIAVPCVHIISRIYGNDRFQQNRLESELHILLDLCEKYIPLSTKVYWIVSHRVLGPRVREYGKSARVKQCNRSVLKLLGPYLRRASSNMFGFLDLYELSCPLRQLTIPQDAIHFQPQWYDVISKHLLQIISS